MNEPNTPVKPDITNFDYIWGSDQDQYLEEDAPKGEPVEGENQQLNQ
ncbi:hypothetical protein ACFFK0_17485 [Paenibacillus chartarius]|uniref:Uncharacterized protein n=1 Tax=Paenibacillus chartarius TaxID=747481 RepID=A0ABV6DNJ9_9BACL